MLPPRAILAMLNNYSWSQINTYILTGMGIISGFVVFATQFRSKSLRNALELLRVELAASNDRGDRLEKERNDYREKLHEALEKFHVAELENAELKASRDFKPVLAFLEKLQTEQTAMFNRMLTALEGNTKVLSRIEAKWEAQNI